MAFGKEYDTDPHGVEFSPARRKANVKSPASGNTVINSYSSTQEETCSVCDGKIGVGKKFARPNYPAAPPYSGEPVQIDDRVVADKVIFCQHCVSAVAPDVRL